MPMLDFRLLTAFSSADGGSAASSRPPIPSSTPCNCRFAPRPAARPLPPPSSDDPKIKAS